MAMLNVPGVFNGAKVWNALVQQNSRRLNLGGAHIDAIFSKCMIPKASHQQTGPNPRAPTLVQFCAPVCRHLTHSAPLRFAQHLRPDALVAPVAVVVLRYQRTPPKHEGGVFQVVGFRGVLAPHARIVNADADCAVNRVVRSGNHSGPPLLGR